MKQLIAKIQDNHVFRGITSFGHVFGSPIRDRYAKMSDLQILRKDWEIIGNDMKTAINIDKVLEELPKDNCNFCGSYICP